MTQDIAQPFSPPHRLMRLGFVGGGHGALIGKIHANGARLSGRWDIVAGALSSDPDTARTSGQDWLLPADRIYNDFHNMAAQEAKRADGIDAVAIVTPNHLHAPVAHAFMEAGIHIISDKPLTAHLDEVDPLIAAQRRSGVIFGVTYAYASHVMVRQAREMIRAGLLGELRQIHVEYLQDWALDLSDQDRNSHWRLDPARNGPSFTVADIGTHAEHLARFVTGLNVKAVRAEFHTTGATKQLEDTAFMMLKFGDDDIDVPGTLLVSQAMAGQECGLRLRVSGTKGGLEWHQEQPDVLSYRPINAPEQIVSRGHGAGMLPAAERLVRMNRGHPEALSDAWANLYLELAIAIEAHSLGKRLPDTFLAYPTLKDGALGMRFVDAALRSHNSVSHNHYCEISQDFPET